MKTRCYNINSPAYKNYGGRGIKVCDRWLGPDGFLNFAADMGERPSNNCSLDRINNNGDYCPENCRWTDVVTQANNRRANKTLTFNGETLTEAEWARKIGVKYTTLHERIRRGIPVEKALTMKTQSKKDSLYILAKEKGVDRLRVYKRLKRGWSLDDALNIPPQKNGGWRATKHHQEH